MRQWSWVLVWIADGPKQPLGPSLGRLDEPVELQAEVLGDSRVVARLGDELVQLAVGAGQDHGGKSTSTRSAVNNAAGRAVS